MPTCAATNLIHHIVMYGILQENNSCAKQLPSVEMGLLNTVAFLSLLLKIDEKKLEIYHLTSV